MSRVNAMQEKLQRTFVREEAYRTLRDWIVEGSLEPGCKLRDKELAEKLGVSRTPIREALLRLEDEGLVKTKPNSSTFVCPIDFHNTFHLYSLVWTLEQLALTQALPLLTDEHIQTMAKANALLDQSLKNGDRLAALNADNDFHSVYVQLSQNRELEKILSGIKNKLKRLELFYFENVKETHRSCEEHEQIIEALKQKNLPSALKAIEHNWKASFSRLNPQESL